MARPLSQPKFGLIWLAHEIQPNQRKNRSRETHIKRANEQRGGEGVKKGSKNSIEIKIIRCAANTSIKGWLSMSLLLQHGYPALVFLQAKRSSTPSTFCLTLRKLLLQRLCERSRKREFLLFSGRVLFFSFSRILFWTNEMPFSPRNRRNFFFNGEKLLLFSPANDLRAPHRGLLGNKYDRPHTGLATQQRPR